MIKFANMCLLWLCFYRFWVFGHVLDLDCSLGLESFSSYHWLGLGIWSFQFKISSCLGITPDKLDLGFGPFGSFFFFYIKGTDLELQPSDSFDQIDFILQLLFVRLERLNFWLSQVLWVRFGYQIGVMCQLGHGFIRI